jgi:hypothetical protein
MKKIDTTNIAGLAKAPYIKDTHNHYKESIQECTSEIIKGILGSYNSGDIIILYGCVVTANIPGVSSLSAGAVYYNGEIYIVDDEATLTTAGLETLVWEIVTTYISSDSTLEWSDGVIRDLHQIDRMTLVPGLTGTGLADYDGVTVGYLDEYFQRSVSTGRLRTKIVNIGDWNMDTDATKNVAHGITDFLKIRNVQVLIIRDSANATYDLNACDSSGVSYGGVTGIGSTNITLMRVAGQFFDDVNFDSTSFNRGYIVIQYIE